MFVLEPFKILRNVKSGCLLVEPELKGDLPSGACRIPPGYNAHNNVAKIVRDSLAGSINSGPNFMLASI